MLMGLINLRSTICFELNETDPASNALCSLFCAEDSDVDNAALLVERREGKLPPGVFTRRVVMLRMPLGIPQ